MASEYFGPEGADRRNPKQRLFDHAVEEKGLNRDYMSKINAALGIFEIYGIDHDVSILNRLRPLPTYRDYLIQTHGQIGEEAANRTDARQVSQFDDLVREYNRLLSKFKQGKEINRARELLSEMVKLYPTPATQEEVERERLKARGK